MRKKERKGKEMRTKINRAKKRRRIFGDKHPVYRENR